MREPTVARLDEPAFQAYQILHFGFAILPIVVGLDKFFHVLAKWTDYLAPVFPRTLGVTPDTFMMGVGVIEVIAGLLVAVKPRYGAYLVAAWLAGIIVNVLILGQYFDIAMRDLGLALGALALGRLSANYD